MACHYESLRCSKGWPAHVGATSSSGPLHSVRDWQEAGRHRALSKVFLMANPSSTLERPHTLVVRAAFWLRARATDFCTGAKGRIVLRRMTRPHIHDASCCPPTTRRNDQCRRMSHLERPVRHAHVQAHQCDCSRKGCQQGRQSAAIWAQGRTMRYRTSE